MNSFINFISFLELFCDSDLIGILIDFFFCGVNQFSSFLGDPGSSLKIFQNPFLIDEQISTINLSWNPIAMTRCFITLNPQPFNPNLFEGNRRL
jgi:hypothetical protein